MAKKKKEPELTEEKVLKAEVLIPNLNIRKGPGFDHEKTGKFTGKGKFELAETNGEWGRLASGEGWIWIGNPEFVEVK